MSSCSLDTLALSLPSTSSWLGLAYCPNGEAEFSDEAPIDATFANQCVQQLDRRGPPLPVGPAEASEASVGPSSQKRPSVWTGPGLPKRAILKPQAPTWRLDYYVIIEFLNELSLIRMDVSQSGLAAARIDNWTVQWTVHGPFGCWTHCEAVMCSRRTMTWSPRTNMVGHRCHGLQRTGTMLP